MRFPHTIEPGNGKFPLTTAVQDGAAATEAVMCQPLGSLSCAAFLAHAEHIVDSAFESHDDMLCVPRQLADVLGVNMDEAISYFDEMLEPGWQQRGMAALDVETAIIVSTTRTLVRGDEALLNVTSENEFLA